MSSFHDIFPNAKITVTTEAHVCVWGCVWGLCGCVWVWVWVCGCGCGCFWGVGATLLDMCNLSSPSRDQTSNPCPLPWKHGVLTTGPWGSPSLSYKCNMFVIKRKIVVKKTNIKCGDRVKPASPLSTLFRLYFQAYHFHSPTLGNILLGEWSS